MQSRATIRFARAAGGTFDFASLSRWRVAKLLRDLVLVFSCTLLVVIVPVAWFSPLQQQLRLLCRWRGEFPLANGLYDS